MSARLLIFDCDGVLIDSEMIACRAEAACLTSLGIAISAEQLVERYLGIGMATMLADLQERAGAALPMLPANFAATLHRAIATAFDAELQPMAGIFDVLRTLRGPRCVASGSAPERLLHSLSVAGLLPQFEPHIFSASQVARGKPAPDLCLFAASRMDAAPPDCVVVEDSVAGVQGAVAAGMRVIGFIGGSHCRPGHAANLRAAGAAAICDDMRSLPSLI